jgi:hypothetical protein
MSANARERGTFCLRARHEMGKDGKVSWIRVRDPKR